VVLEIKLMNNHTITYPVKILFLAANPQGTSLLALDKEMRKIDEQLSHSSSSAQFQVEQKWAVRTRDLIQALNDVQPQIVHFCGHGDGLNGLVFENKKRSVKPVSTEAIAKLFELFADQVKCVLLNACYAEVQADAIVQHIDYVIGMRRAVQDNLAIAFSMGFYQGLGANQSIEMAFQRGCDAVKEEVSQNSTIDRKFVLDNDIEMDKLILPDHLIPVLKKKGDV